MFFCTKCATLNEKSLCPQCKKVGRIVKDEDIVLIGKFDSLKASMIEPILKDNHIPYQRKAKLGSGFVVQAGNFLEEISIFVPYAIYNKVIELVFPFLEN